MGLHTTWVCVRGLGKARVLEALGLVETREVEGLSVATAAFTELPDGWVVVHYGRGWALDAEDVASRFPEGEVIWGISSEGVMWSGAYGLNDGDLVWSVEHDSDKDNLGLQMTGAPPPELAAIHERLKRVQAEPGNDDVDCIFAKRA